MTEPDYVAIVGEHRAAHPYFLDGVKRERERIIGLLNCERPEDDEVNRLLSIDHVIALIKGEN